MNEESTKSPPKQFQPISRTVLAVAVSCVLAATIGVTFLTSLLAATEIPAPRPGAPLAPNPSTRIEAIRTGLGAGATVGAAFALLLAFRRQRHQEHTSRELRWAADQTELDRGRDIDQREEASRRDHERQVRVAADAAEDAKQRRITELYASSVDQIGSENAAVRLGGLYALERLGQNEDDQQQAIANVVCAYLRMPYETPQTDLQDYDMPKPQRLVAQLQEEQVRIPAQKTLANHLAAYDKDKYWGTLDIDLSDANLYKFYFGQTTPGLTNFMSAQFTGDFLFFGGATFTNNVGFAYAIFHPKPNFYGARFLGDTAFYQTEFRKGAMLTNCRFERTVTFSEVKGIQGIDLTGSRISERYLRMSQLPPGWKAGIEVDDDGLVPIVAEPE